MRFVVVHTLMVVADQELLTLHSVTTLKSVKCNDVNKKQLKLTNFVPAGNV